MAASGRAARRPGEPPPEPRRWRLMQTPLQGFVLGAVWLALFVMQLVVWVRTRQPLPWYVVGFMVVCGGLAATYLTMATRLLRRRRAR